MSINNVLNSKTSTGKCPFYNLHSNDSKGNNIKNPHINPHSFINQNLISERIDKESNEKIEKEEFNEKKKDESDEEEESGGGCPIMNKGINLNQIPLI